METTKNFWSCEGCKKQTFVLGNAMPPLDGCEKCNGRKYVKAGMLRNEAKTSSEFSIQGLSVAQFVGGASQLL